METSEYLASVTAIHEEARRRGLFFQTCEDTDLHGRSVRLAGRDLVSFSSCSYLGLERHPALVAGVHDAVDRYGVQFSSSRGYLSAPIYAEIEALLSEVFGGYALVTPSSTLAHQIALPVLATEKDAIVFDHQAHRSVQVGTTLARAGGATVEIVRHSRLEEAAGIVRRLAAKHRTVWFATDGVFSMYGDLAPIQLLRQLLDVAPNVRLYVDDAHGMSWVGPNGRGSFLSRMPMSERIVLATSFAKGFGAGGGCLVFASEKEREHVRLTGGPYVFSGPMQPPMMGAVLAGAKIHLSPEIEVLQARLRARVDLTNASLQDAGLPLLAVNESPIFFVETGKPRVAFQIAESMARDGFYLNVSAYPTVPMNRAGLRFTITSVHTPEEIQAAIERLSVHVPAALAAEGLAADELSAMFARTIPDEARRSEAYADQARRQRTWLDLLSGTVGAGRSPSTHRLDTDPPPPLLTFELARTIQLVDRATWDHCLGAAGACSWDAMAAMESAFGGRSRPEHEWEFLYIVVRDAHGIPVATTFFTVALHKDDMLMRPEVSFAVEARRQEEPYFLTSKVVTMGSLFSEGNHLYLDRRGPWREALRRILGVAEEEYERVKAGALLLRDLPGDDAEMEAFLLDEGLARVPMLDSWFVDLRPGDVPALTDRFGAGSRRRRTRLREVSELAEGYERIVWGVHGRPLPEALLSQIHRLYLNVAAKKLRLNVFTLPERLLSALAASPAWDIVSLHLAPARGGPADGRPIAFYAAHRHEADYAPFLCGLDYDYVFSHGAYRVLLLTAVRRATEIGASTVHLGMDAAHEKHRLGARPASNCVYVRARDHYGGAVLREIVAEVGLGSPQSAAGK